MEKNIFISEEKYLEAKRKMKKESNYFTESELENLMQFLM